jgi:hypothetical protein
MDLLVPGWLNEDPEYHSRVAGAILLTEALRDLRILRMALTKSD